MDDNDPLLRVPTIPHDLDSVDDPVSHLLPDSTILQHEHSADNSPSDDSPSSGIVKKNGFFRTWLATSTSIRPTGEPTNIEWGIHWSTPVSIVMALFLGIASAITHHIYYSFLHDTTVGNESRQRWTFWIGSGLAFFTKVMLTGALGISRTQWVWLTLRQDWFNLEGIDALFGMISDPVFFLNWKTMKRAKVATIMAIAMWIFPLSAILTPGTISIATVSHTETVPCSVPSLLFEFDHNSTARIPDWGVLHNNTVTLPLVFWATSQRNKTVEEFQYNFMPFRFLKLAAYTGSVARLPDLQPADSRSLTTVGAKCGANCTYTIEFLGPSITCTEFTAWNNTEWLNAKDYMGESIYRSVRKWSTISFLLGFIDRDHAPEPSIFQCNTSTARYTVEQGIQNRQFLHPVIKNVETIELPDFEPPIYPNKAYMFNVGLFIAIYDIIEGEWIPNRTMAAPPVMSTMLMYYNNTEFGTGIELITQMMLVSMLAYRETIGDHVFVLDVAAVQDTECKTTVNLVIYVYSARTLLVVYGLAVACALATSAAGFIALGQNGIASNKTVSSIIRTTRNRTLDECIVGGDCLGGDLMSLELQKVKLQFGALKAGTMGTAPFALGVKGEIYPIKRD